MHWTVKFVAFRPLFECSAGRSNGVARNTYRPGKLGQKRPEVALPLVNENDIQSFFCREFDSSLVSGQPEGVTNQGKRETTR